MGRCRIILDPPHRVTDQTGVYTAAHIGGGRYDVPMQEAGNRYRWKPTDHVSEATDRVAGDLGRAGGVPPLGAKIVAQGRAGAHDGADAHEAARQFLSPKLTDLHDPALLPGASEAAKRLIRAVEDRQPIVIYGDYDVDGITASAVLWHTLRLADADVRTYIPHRLDEGYGLNSEAIETITRESDSKPLIISVDCGITAIEPARVAKELGVDLVYSGRG